MQRARFSIKWALPLEPGLSTHVALCDHEGDHREWHGEGADEADALANLIGLMTQQGASREALEYAATAYRSRLPSE